MDNITSLKPALADKWLQKQRAQLDPTSLFAIDYEDIHRQQGEAANDDANDAVYFGPKSTAQIRRLCDAFGFDRLPGTWAEFKGVLLYCQMLQGMLLGPRTEPVDEAVRRHGLNVIQRYFPMDYDAMVAFFDNDIEKMREIHRNANTMARLAKEHREFPEAE